MSDAELERLDQIAETFHYTSSESEFHASDESSDIDENATALPTNYLTENNDVLNAASWQDLEDERRFLERQHQSNLQTIIDKFENEVDDGDIVDLQTGRIITDVGHLRAMVPRMGILEESSSSDESIEGEEEKGGVLFMVCQRPLKYLEEVIRI